MIVRPDQVYAKPEGIPLRFDLFRPDGDEPIPLVVCIHGGGWISGSKEDYRDVAIRLAEAGFASACLNYRLAPLHPFPAAVEDILSFVSLAVTSGESWGIDPQRIATLGNSAGGQLAAMAGLIPAFKGEPGPAAVVDISGLNDLTRPREQHFPISWSFLEEFIGVPYEGNEDLYRQASPISYVTPDAPRFLVIHGEQDDVVPLEQSETLVAELKEHGVHYRFEKLSGESHSFSPQGWMKIERLFVDFLEDTFAHALR